MLQNATNNNGKRLAAAIIAFAMVVCAVALVVPSEVNGEPTTNGTTVTVQDTTDFYAVIANDGGAYDSVTTISLAGNVTLTDNLTTTLNIVTNAYTLNLGGYTLTLVGTAYINPSAGTITNGTIQNSPDNYSNTQMIAFEGGVATITDVDVILNKTESGPYFAINVYARGTDATLNMTGGSITSDTEDFGAVMTIRENQTVTPTANFINVDIDGLVNVNAVNSILSFVSNDGTDRTVNLNYTVAASVSNDTLTLTGYSVGKTVLGWDGESSNAESPQSNAEITVSEEFDLGTVTTGSAAKNNVSSTYSITVESGDLTMNGGDEDLTVTVDSGANLNATDLNATSLNVAGTATLEGENTSETMAINATSPDARVTDQTGLGLDIGTSIASYNALANGATHGTSNNDDGTTGTWVLDKGVLTLTNYHGGLYFQGLTGNDFHEVVLVGENVITIDASVIEPLSEGSLITFAVFRPATSGDLSIHSDGTGSLEINITNDATVSADGTSTITEIALNEAEKKITAIWASNVTISDVASLTINMDVDGITLYNPGPNTANNSKIAAIYASNLLTISSDVNIEMTGVVTDPKTEQTGYYSEAVYGLYAGNGIRVSDCNVNINVCETDSLAFAISGPSANSGTPETITFTDVTGQISGGNRGIQTSTSILTFSGSTLTISGNEKAIQANNVGGSVVITGNSYITLELLNPIISEETPSAYNGGIDDRYGIKVIDLTVDTGSTLDTQGMRLFDRDNTTASYSNSGVVIVRGGYTQNTVEDAGAVAGLKSDSLTVFVVSGIGSVLQNNRTYIADNTAITPTTVLISGDSGDVQGETATNVTEANDLLQRSDVSEITIVVSGGNPVDLNTLVVPAGKTVYVDGQVYGEVTTLNGTIVVSSADGLVFNGVSIDASSEVTVGTDTNGNVVVNGTVTRATIEEDHTMTVVGTINGTVTGNGSDVTFNNVTSTTGIVLTGGSVEITGDFVLNGNPSTGSAIEGTTGTLVVTGNSNITGTGTISVNNLTINEGVTLTIGQNVTIQLDRDNSDSLVINQRATLTGDGQVRLVNGSMGITNNGTLDVDVFAEGSAVAQDVADFVNALPYYDQITVSGDLDFTVEALQNDNITARSFTVDDEKNITVNSGVKITVGDRVTLEFANLVVVDGANGADFEMEIQDGATLIIDNSDIFAAVDVQDGATLTLRNCETTITGASTPVSQIGFGKTVTFSDGYTVGSNMDVYGAISIPEGNTLNISRNASVDVYETGAFTVSGTLNLNGTMNVDGEVSVSGTMTVASTADISVTDEVIDNGEVTTPAGKVDIIGTMSVSGTVSGTILNHGSIAFAGTSDGATIDMYGGASLTVTSMAGTGTLNVIGATDYQKANNNELDFEVYTAQIELSGVAGLQVSASESVTAATSTAGAKITMTLDISGDVTAGSIETSLPIVNEKTRAVTVTQTLNLADEVTLTFGAGEYTVDGTINAAAGATIENYGEITVDGEVTVVAATSNAAVIINRESGSINAVYYDVTTPAVTGVSAAFVTKTYTSLASAVDVTNADDATIYAIGEITVDADTSITVPATLKLSSTAQITVKGTLVFSDYETSYLTKTNEIKSDVLIDEAPARTYTSLANAIEMGVTEIVLNDDVIIESDLTIPEGITVSSDEHKVTVGTATMTSDVTLTVEGALELTGTSPGIDIVPDVPSSTNANVTYEAGVALSGMGYVYITNADDLTDEIAGAYYQKLPSETASAPVDVIATIDRAAADSANAYVTNEEAIITIYGAVSTVNEITFTAPENATLEVYLLSIKDTIDDDVDETLKSSLTAPSITLVGQTAFITSDYYIENDTAGVDDVTVQTTVDAVFVYGESEIDINSIVGAMAVSPEVIDEVTYFTATIGATGYEVSSGIATVLSGNVLVSGSIGGTTTNGATIAVANGATMTVPGEIAINQYGKLNVEGTMAVQGQVTVNGTADVTGQVTVTGDMDVTGTLNVNGGTVETATAENSTTPGTIDITGTAVVGTKPTSIGFTSTGTLTGAQVTGSGIVKAYNGASVTMLANTDGTSTAVSTVLNIRAAGGEYFAYMTVYAAAGNDTLQTNAVEVFSDVINEEVFALEGYDTGLFYEDGSVNNSGLFKYSNWYTGADRVANTALTKDINVGAQANLYAQVDLVEVGITVSEGTGLNLYIDDIAVNSGSVDLSIGTHTVRFDVQAQYDGSNATITFNGQTVANGGTIEVTTSSAGYVLACSGAVPSSGSGDITVNVPSQDDGMSLTDILLIVLVILIVVMAIIVALRLMRS